MNENTFQQHNTVATAVGILVLAEGIIFLVAALLHLGVPLPVGFSEPRILPAFIVESFIGLFFAASAFSLFTGQRWAWLMTLGAHLVSIAGILLGIAAVTFGPGPDTTANAIYHRVMLAVAIAATIFLLTPTARAALEQTKGS